MAIDITNNHIGIALAYYRQQSTPSVSVGSDNDDTDNNTQAHIATSITPLPPIPYMSDRPYHPSYAFLHHHQPDGAHNMPRCLERIERTIEIADQLAQLAINRQVKGIVVRWPGELASAVGSGSSELSKPKSTREVDEGNLLYSTTTIRNVGRDVGFKSVSDGSMGYMRGRILYLLDKCCTRHGHAQTNVHNMDPLLMEGSRPFTLFDTSVSERDWIVCKQPTDRNNARQNEMHQLKNRDKYGNSVAEVDLWGRCPIFGNQPPLPQQGKFYYSSMESSHSGYTVSTHFELGSDCGDHGRGAKQSHQRNLAYFDGLHENESVRVHQFYRSLSAMHTLCDFAKENLQGRIVLPVWASTSYAAASNHTTTGMSCDECNDLRTMSQPDNGSSHSSTSSSKMQLPLKCKQSTGAVTLVQLPIRKGARRSKR